MATHHFKLVPKAYDSFINQTQVIESRLYDEKRRKVEVGDVIIFTNTEDSSQSFETKVTELLKYPSFREMYSDNEPSLFGSASVEVLTNAVHKYYTPEQEKELGVIGIKVTLI